MNGKKGSVSIDVDLKLPDPIPRWNGKWVMDVWDFAMEDKNRVIFSLKVGLAVLLSSLLILFRAPFDIFGTNIIWSIITVAIMFEYTVGAMFNRGFNRALGSILAGIIAIVVIQIGLTCGRVAEPYIIGISIFFIGAVTSFMKLWPSLVPYEYGFRVILFTYCLIIVSGYRMGNPIRTAMDRLYSIAIGGLIAVLVNVLIFPIWAGEQLHNELISSFSSVADSLEECVKKYLGDDELDRTEEFEKKVLDDFADEPAFKKCKATLNASGKLESLANSAKWEPPHGRFRHFFYPWSEYVKVGAVLRYCAYEVMALHGCVHSEIQAPYTLRSTFQPEILDAANQAAELIRSLAKDISNMKISLHTNLLIRVHTSTERLQRSIDTHSYLLTPIHECAKVSNNRDLSENVKPVRIRLHSWPSREVDVESLDQMDGSGEMERVVPKMKAFESTAALSLATFTSLLIEFVARLDHLVDAVDVLGEMAKFKMEK